MESKDQYQSLDKIYINPTHIVNKSFQRVVWSDDEADVLNENNLALNKNLSDSGYSIPSKCHVSDIDSKPKRQNDNSNKQCAAYQGRHIPFKLKLGYKHKFSELSSCSDSEDKCGKISLQDLNNDAKQNYLIGEPATMTDLVSSSIGSQSENTDSAKTVVEKQHTQTKFSQLSSVKPIESERSKPRFLVGGVVMSPRSSIKYQAHESPRSTNQSSLPSMTSFDSTHHPESSEYITSPTACSVSSMASSRKLEWDSGADLGYSKKSKASSSLSTLERLALGTSASYLSLEQGGSQQPKLKIKKRTHRKAGKVDAMTKFSKKYKQQSQPASTTTSSEDQGSIVDVSNRQASLKKVREQTGSRSTLYRYSRKSNRDEASEVTKDPNPCLEKQTSMEPAIATKKVKSGNTRKYGEAQTKYTDPNPTCTEDIVPSSSNAILPRENICQIKGTASTPALTSINLGLKSLSIRLEEHIEHVMKKASYPKLKQYKQLQEYIDFVGFPGENEDEINLKQSIAEIIVKMLGDLKIDSDTSSILTTVTNSCSLPMLADRNNEKYDVTQELPSFPMERCTTPGGSVVCAPYRPTEASKTYFVSINQDCRSSLLGGVAPSKSSDTENSIDCEIAFSQQLQDSSHPVALSHQPHDRIVDHKSEFRSKDGECGGEEDANTGVYQDFHGNMHVAHQPPGYNAQSNCSSIDSVQSDTTTDNQGGADVADLGRHPNVPRLWTSTGSESAYETIREKDRNIEDAVASSFEFYSTSPRDFTEAAARSEQGGVEELSASEGAVALPLAKTWRVQGQDIIDSSSFAMNKRKKDKPLKTSSPREDSNTSSSSASVIQMQKRHYVKRVQKYIHSLQKLEMRLASKLELSSGDLSSTKTNSFRKEVVRAMESQNYCKNTTDRSNASSSLHSTATNTSAQETSDDLIGDSLVIHATLSTKATSVSPVQKSTHKLLKSIGRVDNLQKLMASTNVPGESRAHRFLLNKGRPNSSSSTQSRAEFGHNFPSLSNIASGKPNTRLPNEMAVQTGQSLLNLNVVSSSDESAMRENAKKDLQSLIRPASKYTTKTDTKKSSAKSHLRDEHKTTSQGRSAKNSLKLTHTDPTKKPKSVKLFIPLDTKPKNKLLQMNKQDEMLSLQEALALARPAYVRAAEKRRCKIIRMAEVRQQVQAHNHDVLSHLPDNMKTPTTLNKFIVNNEESPLFNYKAMRAQNQRLYKLLPEAHLKLNAKKKSGVTKTNRLMSTMYSQKLRGKVLTGHVSHGHQHVVTPSQ